MRLAPNITRADQLPRVDIIYAYADSDGALAEAAVKAGAKALVVAGFPTGAGTPAQYQMLNRLKDQGVIVIMSNRGGLGRINTENPYISADNLTPQKARVLAMLALAKDPSPAFRRAGAGDALSLPAAGAAAVLLGEPGIERREIVADRARVGVVLAGEGGERLGPRAGLAHAPSCAFSFSPTALLP